MGLRKPARLTVALAVCMLPMVVFYSLLWRESRPVPMFDDYHAILSFALGLADQQGASAKLLYLFAAQHDEYKLVFEHAVVALDWALTGRLHFGALILLGNLLVLAVAALFWRNSFQSEEPATRCFLFAPLIYLLFQLNYVENLDWAMCGLQTMPVIVFSMAALHFALRKGAPSAGLACLTLLLAALSSANGFLMAPVGLAVLLYRRRFAIAALWSGTVGLALFVYLYRYQRFVPFGTSNAVGLGRKLLFLCSVLGGAIENMHHRPLRNGSVILGITIVATVAYSLHKGFPRTNPFACGVALWCLLSAAAITEKRSGLGQELSLTGRYKIYSDLLLICCILYAASSAAVARDRRAQLRRVGAVALALAVPFAAAADVVGFHFLAHRQRRVQLGIQQYVADPHHNPPEISLGGEPFAGDDPEIARRLLNEVQRRGLYRLPAKPADW